VAALDIEVESRDGRVLVRLFGEFDISGVRPFHVAVTDAGVKPRDMLVIDLRGLSFIGASGLRSLMELQMRSRRDGFNLAIIKGPTLVQRVFQMTGLDHRLVMLDDPAEGNGKDPVV
jgi:anti-anti-sigma factor